MQTFDRRFLYEATTLVAAAVLCAAVANGLASRERKVRWSAASTLPARSAPSAPSTATAPPPVATQPTAAPTATLAPAPTTSALPPAAPTSVAPVTTAPQHAASAPAPATSTAPAPTRPVPAPAAASFPSHPDRPWVEVSGEAVEKLHAAHAPFFDARRTDVYVDGHIAGAQNISVWESDVDEKVKAVYERNLDPDSPIVVYCSGGACEDSHTLAQKLWGIGLNNVLVYKDGFPDWVARKGAVVKGPNP